MITKRNETHEASARSFVSSANAAGCDFPIQNLPFGAFIDGHNSCPSLCVAIGDCVLDLPAAAERGLLGEVDDLLCEVLAEPKLNALMGLGPPHWSRLRRAIFRLPSAPRPRPRPQLMAFIFQ